MQVVTKDAVLDGAADALGYVEDGATAATVEGRAKRKCELIDSLPDGWAFATRTEDGGVVAYGLGEGTEPDFYPAVLRRSGSALSLSDGVTLGTARAARAVAALIEYAAIDAEARER